MLETASVGFRPIYHLLLMEPVLENEFINLDASQSLDAVIEAGTPCIWISLDYWEGGEYETHDLTENLESYAMVHSAIIESKKMIGIGKDTGVQAVLLRDSWIPGLKEALTWFAKGELKVRCEYIAQGPEYGKYFVTYQQVAQSITLMGN